MKKKSFFERMKFFSIPFFSIIQKNCPRFDLPKKWQNDWVAIFNIFNPDQTTVCHIKIGLFKVPRYLYSRIYLSCMILDEMRNRFSNHLQVF